MKRLLRKHYQLLRYSLVSIPTMLVGFGFYLLLTRLLRVKENPANIVATACAIVTAYFSNKLLVFRTPFAGVPAFLREFLAHIASRVAMVGFELGGFYLLHSVWGWYDLPVKLLIAVIVTLLNYAVGRLLVFRHAHKSRAAGRIGI